MNLTVRIHPSWLGHPTDLRQFLAAMVALEGEYDPHVAVMTQAGVDPPDRGDAWDEPPPPPPPPPAPARRNGPAATAPAEEEDPPADGRQLLGWCAKQVPDMKGTVLSYGKKKGLASKIVTWTPEQVSKAYQHCRQVQAQAWGGARQ